MEAKQIPGVPVQKKGAFHDTESKRSFESEELVANHFEILKNRFFFHPSVERIWWGFIRRFQAIRLRWILCGKDAQKRRLYQD